MPKSPTIIEAKIKTEKPLTIEDTNEHKRLLEDVKSEVEITI